MNKKKQKIRIFLSSTRCFYIYYTTLLYRKYKLKKFSVENIKTFMVKAIETTITIPAVL